jgi:hypothetical protein
MKRINKILSSRYSFSIAAIYLLFFLFLSSGKELLHNHKPDINEHADCPVLVISHTFGSGITTNFELQNEFIVESSIDIQKIIPTLQQKPNATYLRGPPLV